MMSMLDTELKVIGNSKMNRYTAKHYMVDTLEQRCLTNLHTHYIFLWNILYLVSNMWEKKQAENF